MIKIIKAILQNGGGGINVRCQEIADQNADRHQNCLIRFRRRNNLRQLLQGTQNRQSRASLGSIKQWLVNNIRCVSCADNIATTIQTTTRSAFCMRCGWWYGRNYRICCDQWNHIFVYHINNGILEFLNNVFRILTLKRGWAAC